MYQNKALKKEAIISEASARPQGWLQDVDHCDSGEVIGNEGGGMKLLVVDVAFGVELPKYKLHYKPLGT
jgi:hypothetical protein